MSTATFPWLSAMLATKQHNPVGRALDQGCWGRRAMDVRHAWSARRRESGHWSGSSRRPCAPEANEPGLVDLRKGPSEKQERTRSRERCARAIALLEASERLSLRRENPGPDSPSFAVGHNCCEEALMAMSGGPQI